MGIVLRVTLVYLVVLVLLRLTTRRILRSATPLDLVVIFLFGGLAMPAVLDSDMSLTGAFLGMSTVSALHFGLSRLRMRWPIVGMLTEGTSVVLYENGFDDNQMSRSRITRQDIEAQMRDSGIRDISQIERIVVEHNGGISIVRDESGG